MPGGDGTGPFGSSSDQQEPFLRNRGGRGPGGPVSAGPNGYCVCPQCGAKLVHHRAIPCTEMKCPKCGSPMVRG